MDLKKYQYDKKRNSEPKLMRINLRTTKEVSEWMTKNKISPQKFWDISINELMKKK